MTAASRFMNKKGHKRAAAVTQAHSPFSTFSLPHLWKENGHLKVPAKQQLYTGIFIEAPY